MKASCVPASAFSHRDPHSQAKATRGFLCVDFSSINFPVFHPLSFSPSALDGRLISAICPTLLCFWNSWHFQFVGDRLPITQLWVWEAVGAS